MTDQRDTYGEGGSLSAGAGDLDGAAGIVDDLEGDGEADSHALARLLGGEEGGEDAGHVLAVDAGSVVADGDGNVVIFAFGDNPDIALFTDGFDGVLDEVAADEVELLGSDADECIAGLEFGVE